MPSFNTSALTKKEAYNLMTGAIVPRPIAWVSTLSADGEPNLAPFSFFNGIAVMPPTLAFTVAFGDDERGFKDTYHNLTTTRECVVNSVTDSNVYAMNTTSKGFAPHINEFEEAHLTPLSSKLVRPMRVKESPIQFECTLNQVVTLENALGRSDVMICNVLMIHVAESIYLGNHKINQEALQAVGRMGGIHYTHTHNLFDMTRFHKIDNSTDL